ncbi:hypothetical protein SSPO_019390 [Streptomyces antimycoticus]|uniref:Uncharacterized protein n=1 Tax=Streptomyces antimycoticus TaxID=68175 RepID=A0A499UPV9_9ACTN|nr:hypothetical protein SSPO_019390 [Streptomyces antimycoticus]
MKAGNAEHGVMDAVAFEAAVAKDLPALHACEDALNASPDPLVYMWSMMRSAADVEIPNSGAGWLMVTFVRRYAVTSRTRSSSDRLQGRPRGRSAACSRRTAAANLPKQRGLSPVKGPIQDGTDAVITPPTP